MNTLVVGALYKVTYYWWHYDKSPVTATLEYLSAIRSTDGDKDVVGFAFITSRAAENATQSIQTIYKDQIVEIKPITPLLRRESDKEYLSSTPSKPRIGEVWLIKLTGHILLRAATVTSLTNKVVGLSFTQGPAASNMYELSDVKFVELVPAASEVDAAIGELETALYNKRGKMNAK